MEGASGGGRGAVAEPEFKVMSAVVGRCAVRSALSGPCGRWRIGREQHGGPKRAVSGLETALYRRAVEAVTEVGNVRAKISRRCCAVMEPRRLGD